MYKMRKRAFQYLMLLMVLIGIGFTQVYAIDNSVSVKMNNILVKTNQPASLSYTVAEEYQNDISFEVADPQDQNKVTISNTTGKWTIRAQSNVTEGDQIAINAKYGDKIVGSCNVYFIRGVNGDVIQYKDKNLNAINYSYSLPFATPTEMNVSFDTSVFSDSSIEGLANATVSNWEWNTDLPEKLDIQVNETDSSKVTLVLCQTDATSHIYAKPWLNIDGTDYLYNYPTYSNNSGNSYISISKEKQSSGITCDPSNIYEGSEINLNFNITNLTDSPEDVVVTWTSNYPDVVPLDGHTSTSVKVQTQKGYIQSGYISCKITATAQINGVTYIDSFSPLYIWKTETDADVDVSTLSDLQKAIDEGKKTIAVDTTIVLPDQTNLDLKGSTILRDSNLTGPVFDITNGEVIITDSTKSGKIDGDGRSAEGALVSVGKGGNLSIQNVSLQNTTNSSGEGGAIAVIDGTLNCTNVTFANNSSKGMVSSSNDYHGGGAIYAMNAVLNIDQCTFTENTAVFGNGGSIYVDQGSTGIIQNNKMSNSEANGSSKYGDGNGGAIYCRIAQNLQILNNNIETCTAGDNGGGIAVVVNMDGMDFSGNRCEIVLDGNIIKNCIATNRGGGLYLVNSLVSQDSSGQNREENCIKLYSGTISGCKADWGGGIDYSGHNMNPLFLTNVLVTNNTAIRGAGIWACPTSETESYSTLGGAIFSNHAVGSSDSMNPLLSSGDEIRYEGEDANIHREDALILQNSEWFSETSTMTVMKRALGGGLVQWYSDEQGNRYSDTSQLADASIYTNTQTSFSLHGELLPQYQELAKKSATLIIEDNVAETRGGGIATNSQIVIGMENADKTIEVKKEWVGNDNHPDSVQVTLIQTDAMGNQVELEEVTLSEQNNWTYNFEDLPAFYLDSDGVQQNYSYTVKEQSIENWVTDIQVSDDGLSIVVVNTYESEENNPDIDEKPDDNENQPNVDVEDGSNSNQEQIDTPSTGDANMINALLVFGVMSLLGITIAVRRKLN